MKAYFLQRVVAFTIDILLVTYLVIGIGAILPTSERYKELSKEYDNLQEEILNEDITDLNYFTGDLSRVSYEMEKENFLFTIISLGLNVAYFICYQVLAKGQTIGKRLMRIIVKKNDDSDIDFIDSIKRGIILHGFLASVILAVLINFLNEDTYFAFSLILQLITGMLFIVSILMAAIRKDGRSLHDLFSNTKVVLVDDRVKDSLEVEEAVVSDSEIENNEDIAVEIKEEKPIKSVKSKKHETKKKVVKEKKTSRSTTPRKKNVEIEAE